MNEYDWSQVFEHAASEADDQYWVTFEQNEIRLSFESVVSAIDSDFAREDAREQVIMGTCALKDMPDGKHFVLSVPLLGNEPSLYTTVEADTIHHAHRLEMYPHFYEWLLQTFDANGISHDTQLFQGVFDAFGQESGLPIEEYKQFCLLHQLIIPSEQKKQSGSLSIGWDIHMDTLNALYEVVANYPDVWEAAGISGEAGDAVGFLRYVLTELYRAVDYALPYYLEAAQSFVMAEAPRIVWEETEKAVAHGAEDTGYYTRQILGMEIDDYIQSPWCVRYFRSLFAQMNEREEMVSVFLGQSQCVRDVHPATRLLNDNPAPDYVHIAGLLDTSNRQHRVPVEALVWEEGMIIEIVSNDFRILRNPRAWDEFIATWETDDPSGGVWRVGESVIDPLRETPRDRLALQLFVPRGLENIAGEMAMLPQVYAAFSARIEELNRNFR